jgi:hypothetical protein
MRDRALSVALCVVLAAVLVAGAGARPAYADDGDDVSGWFNTLCDVLGLQWACWIMEVFNRVKTFWQNIHATLRKATDKSLKAWWWHSLTSVANLLRPGDVAETTGYLRSIKDFLPSDIGDLVEALAKNIDRYTQPNLPEKSPDMLTRKVVDKMPEMLAGATVSMHRQAHYQRAIGEAESAQRRSEQVAKELAQSKSLRDATLQALRDADRLQTNVQNAESSRSVLQYIGEGLADQMRHHATYTAQLVDHLRGLAQQNIMTARELQLVATILARKAIEEEQAAQGAVAGLMGQMYARGEMDTIGLRALGEGLVKLSDPRGGGEGGY